MDKPLSEFFGRFIWDWSRPFLFVQIFPHSSILYWFFKILGIALEQNSNYPHTFLYDYSDIYTIQWILHTTTFTNVFVSLVDSKGLVEIEILLMLLTWQMLMWNMKMCLPDEPTRTKKWIWYLFCLLLLQYLTGLYKDLLQTPPSSKHTFLPKMKVLTAASFNCVRKFLNWWHLSPSLLTPLSGWNVAQTWMNLVCDIYHLSKMNNPQNLTDMSVKLMQMLEDTIVKWEKFLEWFQESDTFWQLYF